MGKETGISWTDHTFNPWWGCTKVSPGCDHCYAETFSLRPIHPLPEGGKGALQIWGKDAPRRTFGEKHWNDPLVWNRNAFKNFGRKARVFCASMADIMDDEAPFGERQRLWQLIDSTPDLDWQLLTKRPHRYARYLPQQFRHNNVWLGTTAENQEFYSVRWPLLRDVAKQKGALSWISYEPAIGPLTMSGFCDVPDWIIFGGESGEGRRECQESWAAHLKNECQIMDVAFFVKQMGGRTPDAGKALIPTYLSIQEFPIEQPYNSGRE